MNKGDVIFGSSRVDPSAPEGAAKGRRIWITVVCVIAFGSVLAVGLTLGLQNHEDHVLTAQITQTEADLRVLGGRIANIKDHEFKTMAEYVAAYAQVEPLLTAYDQKLQEYSELYNTVQQRDQKTRADQYSALAQPLQPRSLAEHIGTYRDHSPDR